MSWDRVANAKTLRSRSLPPALAGFAALCCFAVPFIAGGLGVLAVGSALGFLIVGRVRATGGGVLIALPLPIGSAGYAAAGRVSRAK